MKLRLEKSLRQAIGKRLREIRLFNKLEQTELANRAGLSQAVISQYEKGLTEVSLSFIKFLADNFTVSSDWLIFGTGQSPHENSQKEIEVRFPKSPGAVSPKGKRKSRLEGRDVLREKFVVVDLETTGLSPERNAIIEIGAVKYEAGATEYASMEAVVNPEVYIPDMITRITGISNDMVKDCRVIEEELPHFIEFFEDLPLAIFNASFDMGFLRHNALKIGATIENPVIDVLSLSRKAFPALPNHKLATLKAHFSIRADQSHRALVDCQTTLSVYIECIKKLFG